MSKSLADAYRNLASTLKPQRQGTCGLYSFWFATLLLNEIDPGHGKVVYPRKCEVPSPTHRTTVESARAFSKSKAVGSGQGEVLTLDEMAKIVLHFGYSCVCYTGSPSGRRRFITNHIAVKHPVLFPYMMGRSGPISHFPPGDTAGTHYGPHWSLIIDEDTDHYKYIEPNRPNSLTVALKTDVLASNSFVDNYKYERYWLKHPFKGQSNRPTVSAKDVNSKTLWYDIGDKSRQTLANVLIAVV